MLTRYFAMLHILMLVISISPLQAEDWPQWRGSGRDGVWREQGVVDKFDSDQIDIKWRQPIGPGYSGPTVAAGRVYITDRMDKPQQIERVHCFSEETGKYPPVNNSAI